MFDLVFRNARIFGNSEANTLAIQKGRISYVGRDIRLESAKSVDLQGSTVMPGFIDSHTHLIDLGLSLTRLDLSASQTRADALEKTRLYAQKSESKVVVGYGWDETTWGEKEYLTEKELDFTDKPIMLYRKDMHMAVLNSKAMSICGKKRVGGVFNEESLREIQWLSRPDETEAVAALKGAGIRASSEGITSVRDITGFETNRILRAIDFPLRVFGALYDREYEKQALSHSGWWGVKLFLDGSIGSKSAAHDGWDTSNLKFSNEALGDHLNEFWRSGMPVAMHAIGENAVTQAVEALTDQKGRMRNSIEHFELVKEDILAKIGETTVISSQPNFLQWSGKGGLYENSLGDTWFGLDNPFRKILDAGRRLAFGSDCMPIGPNYGIGMAVNTRHSGQRITLQEAVSAYTEGGAYLLNRECCMGRIEPGYFADLTIQDHKYGDEPEKIAEQKPLGTIRNGTFTFGSPDSIVNRT